MDQLKVFVGMAIFLSQMATSHGITFVSNSALISAHCRSQGGRGGGGEESTGVAMGTERLSISPQSRGHSWRVRGQNYYVCNTYIIILSHTVPSIYVML